MATDDLLRYRLELEIDGTWVDMADPATRPDGTTGRLQTQQALAVSWGKQNETSATQPARFAARLDNSDGALTPGRVMGQWHPHIRRGMGARLSFHGPASQLQLAGAGSRATTPNHAALDVAAPCLAVELAPPILFPPAGSGLFYTLSGRWDEVGNQASFVLILLETGHMQFGWSSDGTPGAGLFITPLTRLIVPVAGGYTIAVAFDPDNGAGATEWTWYQGHRLDDILADPAGHAFETAVSPGTTVVHPGSAPLQAGDIVGSNMEPYPGLVRRIRLTDGGLAGTLAADLDVTGLDETATGVTDGPGRVWSFTNAPLTRWRTVRALTADQIQPRPHPVDGLQVADLTAAGGIRRLGQGQTGLQSTLRRRIASAELAPYVKGYWPGEDGSDATLIATPIPGARPGKIYGSVQLAADDTLPGSKPLPTGSGGQPLGWDYTVPVFTANDWRTDVWVRCPTTVTWTLLYAVHTTGTVRLWIIEENNVGTLRLRGLNAAETEVINVTGAGPNLDNFASVSLLLLQNGGNVEYDVQHVELSAGTVSTTISGSIAGTLGRPTRLGNLLSVPADGMSWGHAVVSTGLDPLWLLASQGQDVADAYTLERAADRFLRLGTEEGVPCRVHGLATDTPTMGPQRPDLDLLGQWREIEATDGGLYVEDPYIPGGFVYRTRASLYNQRPRITLDYATPGPLTPTLAEDDYGRRNVVEAKRPRGSTALATTTPAPAPEDTYRGETTVNVPTDLHLPDQASWGVHLGTTEDMRFPQVPILAESPDLVDELLEVGPGDLARLVNLPFDLPASTVDQLVLGDRASLLPATWDSVLNCGPAGPYQVGVWDDDDLGRYDTAGSELASSADIGTATSLSVATTVGLLWSTAAGEMPFLLYVGGAEVVVTAISGASSPQTFTIQATALNGIVKTMPAGTEVRLWRPSIYAL